MKLYLILLAFLTLQPAFGQTDYYCTVINPISKTNSINEKKVVTSEKFTSNPFNKCFIFCNEKNLYSFKAFFFNFKSKITYNNHNVLFKKYKSYLLQNILAANNLAHYKKLFYKLCILQI
jgi:hypothetical protein